MSDSSTNDPFALYLGAKVTLRPDVKERIEADWDDGIIASAFVTAQGLGIHVVNPEDGSVTPAITLDGVVLPPETLAVLLTTHKMTQMALAQVAAMFDR